MALTDTDQLYIFSFSTCQDPCALALLGEFRTKHCMKPWNHIIYVCTYNIISHIHCYVWINMIDDWMLFLCTWYEQFCNQAGQRVGDTGVLQRQLGNVSVNAVSLKYGCLNGAQSLMPYICFQILLFEVFMVCLIRLGVASPAWTRASKGSIWNQFQTHQNVIEWHKILVLDIN